MAAENWYLDTSLLPPFYWPEKLSIVVQTLLNGVEAPLISQWVRTEFVSALSMRVRMGQESADAASAILAMFQVHVDEGIYEVLPVLQQDYDLACSWLGQFHTPLRAPDALHLAVANNNACLLLTADARMAESARKLGVKVRLVCDA
jgi:predicted nucleic acid-binding protein